MLDLDQINMYTQSRWRINNELRARTSADTAALRGWELQDEELHDTHRAPAQVNVYRRRCTIGSLF
jgi:hypothetical protein